jgi:hypothetical protein
MTTVDRLECPWTPRRNDHVREEGLRRSARSLAARAWCPDGGAERALNTCTDLARWCFPDLDTGSLALVVAWFEDLSCAEDLRDEPGATATEPALSNRWVDAISERCGIGWREKIEALFVEHASSVQWEQTWRERRQPPPLNEYLWHRPRATGVYLCLSLGPAMQRLAPSSPEWRDLRLQTALVAAANHICWSNDLVGADRERGEGNFFSLPAVLQHHGALSRREAVDETIRRCNDAARTVHRCVAALEVSTTRTSTWVGGAPWLGEILAGHLAWCRGSARYAHRADESGVLLPQVAVA